MRPSSETIADAKARWKAMTKKEAKAQLSEMRRRYYEQNVRYMRVQEENEKLRRLVVKLSLASL